MLEWLKLPSQAIEWEYIIVCDEFNPVMDKVAVSEQGKKVFAPANSEYIVEIAKSRLAQKAAIEAQKAVITAETAVITEKTAEKQVSQPIELEITQSTSDSWLSKLTTIEVGGKTYSPAEIVKAKTYVLTYWKRVFEAKSEAAEERNRIRVEEYRNVLEATGAIVNLNEDGTGSVTI